MPYHAPRPCRVPGCNTLVTGKGGLCDQHLSDERKDYNANRRPDFHKMYSTPRWRALRDAQLFEQPICERCGHLAEIAHHIVEHQGDPELFYNPSNLESLCRVCHEQHHRRAANVRRA